MEYEMIGCEIVFLQSAIQRKIMWIVDIMAARVCVSVCLTIFSCSPDNGLWMTGIFVCTLYVRGVCDRVLSVRFLYL